MNDVQHKNLFFDVEHILILKKVDTKKGFEKILKAFFSILILIYANESQSGRSVISPSASFFCSAVKYFL